MNKFALKAVYTGNDLFKKGTKAVEKYVPDEVNALLQDIGKKTLYVLTSR